jgi:hypothetical protein
LLNRQSGDLPHDSKSNENEKRKNRMADTKPDWFAQNAPRPDWFEQNAPQSAATQQPEGSAAGRFVGGLWDAVNPMPMVRILADAAQSGAAALGGGVRPLSPETQAAIKGIIDSHAEQLQKAKDTWAQGEHAEAAGHMLGMIPIIGPAAARAGEQIGGTDPLYDKYGNVLIPGKAPDIAGGLGSTVGLLGAATAPEIGNAAARVAGHPVITEALERAAQTQYGRVLNATTKGNKLRSAEVVPGLLDRGVTAFTLRGLQQKAAANLSAAGHAISDAWESMPEGTAIPLDDIVKNLDESATKAFTIDATPRGEGPAGTVPKGPLGKAGLSHIDSLKQTISNLAEPNPETGAMEIPVERVRQLRQFFDKVAERAGAYDGNNLADWSQAEAHQMAADAMRQHLNNFPGIDALNKEYSFWKNVNQVVSDTLLRREGQAKPLGRKIAGATMQAAGFGMGGVHGAIVGRMAGETLETLATSPAWQTVSAVLKDRLANALAAGREPEALFQIHKMAQEAAAGTTASREQSSAPAVAPNAGIRVPTGFTLDPEVKAPPGFTLDPTPATLPAGPWNKYRTSGPWDKYAEAK